MSKYKRITCNSGFSVSVQGSKTNYCSPPNNVGPYTAVELGFPSSFEELLEEYAEDRSNPTETIYGWVPVGIVRSLVIKHGGIISGELPPFKWTDEQSFILAESLQTHGINHE